MMTKITFVPEPFGGSPGASGKGRRGHIQRRRAGQHPRPSRLLRFLQPAGGTRDPRQRPIGSEWPGRRQRRASLRDFFLRRGLHRQPKRLDDRNSTTATASPAAGGGAVPPISEEHCPPNAPIKGNESSGIYHMPGDAYYDATHPEVCFATPQDAEAAGYRAAEV